MPQAIDVLIIDPCDSDAKKTAAAIRRKAPKTSTARVTEGSQAARLMFERGLFTVEPQMPRLIIVDLAATGDSAKTTLTRLKTYPHAREVPVVVFSARRNARDILQSHLLGACMNIVKPADPVEYASAVERIVTMWAAGCFRWQSLEAG